MARTRTGYALLTPDGRIAQELPFFPEVNGVVDTRIEYTPRGFKTPIFVFSPRLNEELPSGYKLVERALDDPGAPSPFHSFTDSPPALDGDSVVVTRTYAVEPDIVPPVVTMAQCRLALSQIGRLAEADAAVQASANERLKILWEYALDVRRDAPELLGMATTMNLTAAEVDGLFRLAKSL